MVGLMRYQRSPVALVAVFVGIVVGRVLGIAPPFPMPDFGLHLPHVVAYNEDERRRHARGLGAFDFITKPVDFRPVEGAVGRLPDAAQLLNLQGQQRAAVCILYRFGSENATLHHSHESSGNKSMRHEKALGFRQGDSRVITVQFTGTWKNELGSEMTLVQTGQSLTGKYESVVSGKGVVAPDKADRE